MRRISFAVSLIFLSAPAFAQSDLDNSYPDDAPMSFASAHSIISAEFLDPRSSQYKDMFLVTRADQKQYICGWVNSKNSSGGYGPFAPFLLNVSNESAAVGTFYQDKTLGSFILKVFDMAQCSERLGLR